MVAWRGVVLADWVRRRWEEMMRWSVGVGMVNGGLKDFKDLKTKTKFVKRFKTELIFWMTWQRTTPWSMNEGRSLIRKIQKGVR